MITYTKIIILNKLLMNLLQMWLMSGDDVMVIIQELIVYIIAKSYEDTSIGCIFQFHKAIVFESM